MAVDKSAVHTIFPGIFAAIAVKNLALRKDLLSFIESIVYKSILHPCDHSSCDHAGFILLRRKCEPVTQPNMGAISAKFQIESRAN